MFIDTPVNTLKLATLDDGITDDGTHYLLRMRRDASQFFFTSRGAIPTDTQYSEVAQFFCEIAELDFTAGDVAAILALYPFARVKVAMAGGIGPTDVRDELSDVVAHFFLGCTWPTFDGKVDIAAFVALLQKQARLMGFGKQPAIAN